MRKFCLITALLIVAVMCNAKITFASEKSDFNLQTIPAPFTELTNVRANAAMSTGYYFYSSGAGSTGKWVAGNLPDGTNDNILPETFEPLLWRAIYPGPRSVPSKELESGIDKINHLILPPTSTRQTPAEGIVILGIQPNLKSI